MVRYLLTIDMSGDETYKDLGTSELASLDNIEVVTIVTLSDDLVPCVLADLLHGAKHDFKLFWVQVGEHECLRKFGLESLQCIVTLLIEWRLELLLFVPVAKGLGTDRLSWSPASLGLLDLLNRQLEDIITLGF